MAAQYYLTPSLDLQDAEHFLFFLVYWPNLSPVSSVPVTSLVQIQLALQLLQCQHEMQDDVPMVLTGDVLPLPV